MKGLFFVILMGICLTAYGYSENLYIVCSKNNFEANYTDISSGGENYSLDGNKVQFSNRFTGAQVKQLVSDPDVEIYNEEEIRIVLNSEDWKEPDPFTVVVDKKFRKDYEDATDKLKFLKDKLKLK